MDHKRKNSQHSDQSQRDDIPRYKNSSSSSMHDKKVSHDNYAQAHKRSTTSRLDEHRAKRGSLPSSKRTKHPPKPHKQNIIAKWVNNWFDRVVGAMRADGLSSADEVYAPHKTTRDFIWNTLGSASWAAVFPIVTMVSTQLVGIEEAGMISMAFVIGILLMFVGNFGVRTYQISDINREHSFADYQVNRWLTCALMLLIGFLYCNLRGYSEEMFSLSMAVIVYKFVDALADVYEGRLQQVDKLYLGGISQTIRSVAALIVFIITLFITRNGVIACTAMAIVAIASFVLITWPLALLETPKSRPLNTKSVILLFKITAPLFVAIFFFNLIENMPKFVMETALPYENQLYYNALFFPAQMILISSQLVYKPLLLRMAGVWQESDKRRKFNLLLAGIFGIIALITSLFAIVMAGVGIPVLNVLYGVDFTQYKSLMFLMIVTGGITAAIDFLYQVVTIMRRQKDVTVLFVMAFIFSIFIPILLVHYAELEGAVLSYVIVEAILLILLSWEYLRIRRALRGKTISDTPVDRTSFVPLMDIADPVVGRGISADEDTESYGEEPEEEPKLRPSELRAIREHREEVMRRRTHQK